MKIGIYGSTSSVSGSVSSKARILGGYIAKLGHEIVTGGSSGYPYDAVLAASNQGGKCTAFSPAINAEDHKNKYSLPTIGFSDFVYIPTNYEYKDQADVCFKYRNLSSVAYVDIAIVIAGRIGAMSEFTMAYDLGKKTGVLERTGGITNRAIKILVTDASKEGKQKVEFEIDPVVLLDKLLS